jgi:hypothetical protein
LTKSPAEAQAALYRQPLKKKPTPLRRC